ncbi:MAG: nucleotidyl transferase AbiEii/AbiGii toxin family protein [Acidithiobacillus ferriphilus]
MDSLNNLRDAMLPESTRKLWATIRNEPVNRDFSGFILVGGTALTLQIGHRVSEDLDFIWAHRHPSTRYDNLPRQQIDRAMFHLRMGFPVEKISYPAEEDDFANDGLDLDDFHQDYIVGGTKVTFFKASPDACMALGCDVDKSRDDPLRVATIHEVFLLKSLVITERTKTRDYFDLYTLLKKYGVDLRDAHDVLLKSGAIRGWDIFCDRLSNLPVRKDDEGYHQMLAEEDRPSLDDMREFFRDCIGRYETTRKNVAAPASQQEISPESGPPPPRMRR